MFFVARVHFTRRSVFPPIDVINRVIYSLTFYVLFFLFLLVSSFSRVTRLIAGYDGHERETRLPRAILHASSEAERHAAAAVAALILFAQWEKTLISATAASGKGKYLSRCLVNAAHRPARTHTNLGRSRSLQTPRRCVAGDTRRGVRVREMIAG